GSFLPLRDEDRVVAEALRAARLLGDLSFEQTGAAHLTAVQVEGDELADVASRPVLHAAQLVQELRDRLLALGRVAGRENPRTSAERSHLEPGVLAEHPLVRRCERMPEAGLSRSVLVVGRARLGRVVLGVQGLELP